MTDPTLWNRLPLEHSPTWLRPLLLSTGASLVEDSDALMWRYPSYRAHLDIDVDKLLSYSVGVGSEGNPLRHRTYYSEEEILDVRARLATTPAVDEEEQ